MRNESGIAEHLEEDELVRLLDDEVEAGERSAWNEHLESCADCSQRFDELSEASVWFRDNVGVLDAGHAPSDIARGRAISTVREKGRQAVPAARSNQAFMRAAAVVAVIIVGGLTVQPVRAWIVTSVERLTGRYEVAPLVEAPAAPVEATGAVFAFQPTGEVFRIDLESSQVRGEIRIEVAEGEQASAQILGGTGETLTVLPAGLWIDNEAASGASYRIQLPAGSVRRIEVTAGGRVISSQAYGGTPVTITVNLAAGTQSP